MNIILIVIAVFSATLIGSIIANILIKKKNTKEEVDDGTLEDRIARLSSDALDKNSERFITMAKEVLGAEKKEIRVDLEGKKSSIANLIEEIRRDIKKNEEKIARSDEAQIKSFSALKSELENYKQVTGDLKLSTDKLKDLLSNNQMRGAFGEQVAEDLLKMSGFVIGQSYSKNTTQNTQSTRPDFTIFLPDKTKVNIDVKFPYSSLVKYTEAGNKTEREKYLRDFKHDVKEKIKQVCTRDYINPEEKTVDFVVLFIPNEMIFSFIYDKMNDVWEEAMKKKVVLAGPFSFTAILRIVKQAYSNFRYQKNLHHIIGLIHKFDEEYQKYSTAVDVLGDRISSTTKQFDAVSNTRNRQLTKVIDKIKSHDVLEEDQDKLLEKK